VKAHSGWSPADDKVAGAVESSTPRDVVTLSTVRSRWAVLGAMLLAWVSTILALLNVGATAASGVALLASIGVVVYARGARWLPSLLLLPMVPYAIGPLYAYSVGDRLWPFPEGPTYSAATLFMVTTMYVAVAVPIAAGLEPVVGRWMTRSVHGILELGSHPIVRLGAVAAVLVFAAQAWLIVAEHGVLTAGRSRRGVEMLLWIAGTLTGQMIAVTATVLIVAAIARSRSVQRLVLGLLLLAMWTPFVLGGGRRILIYAAVPAVILLYVSGGAWMRRLVAVGAAAGILWFFVVPMIYAGGGDFADNGHGEWSMAGAPFVAQFSGALSLQDVGASGWPENLMRALPDWLGGDSVEVLADALAHGTSLYPTGTSGSIWSDVWAEDVVTATFSLVIVVAVLLCVPLLLERVIPGSLILATGTFALLGRTHTPYALTTIVVPPLILAAAWLLLKAVKPGTRRERVVLSGLPSQSRTDETTDLPRTSRSAETHSLGPTHTGVPPR
jgi:hypothetical protein